MAERYLLDTHTWVWLQEGDKTLSPSIVKLVDDARRDSQVHVSAISVWEIALLEKAGRIQLAAPIEDWLHAAFTRGSLQLSPLGPAIAVESARLPGNLHRDPADRILAATARIEGLTLLTRDTRLLDYSRKGHLRARKV